MASDTPRASESRKGRARYPRQRTDPIYWLRWLFLLGWAAVFWYSSNVLFPIVQSALSNPGILLQSETWRQVLPGPLSKAGVPVWVYIAIAVVFLLIAVGALLATIELGIEAEHRIRRVVHTELEDLGIIHDDAVAQPLSSAREGVPQDDALLPAPDPFIGRRDALDWLEQRLSTRGGPEDRVSAITALGGLGGIGKSALAGQALKELRMHKRFPDGVAVVLANNRRDARALLRAVLARFEPRIDAAIPEDASLGDLATAAHTLLDGKDALIVLDNLEPDDARLGWRAAQVLDVLKATGVAVLVTARQEVSGVPAGGTRQLDVLPEHEARDLFAEYYAGTPWANLAAADQQAAEDILTTLGRHTLAVTLAARYAATTGRPLAKVAEELANPQRALTLQVPDVPTSVLSTFDLSYRDLPKDAQRLFRALGAAGTNELGRMATLALAKALDVHEPEAKVDLLVARALARPSTLAGLPDGADGERLTLHPLISEFASSLLGNGPERERAEDALAQFYGMYAVTNNIAYPLLAADEANITAALDGAHARGNRDRVVSRLCWGMAQFWRDRGKYREGLERLAWGIAAAVAVASASQDRDARILEARLVSTYGNILGNTGRLADASAYYEQSLAIRREVGDRQGEGVDFSNLGQVARERGQLGEAQAYFEQALPIFRDIGDRRNEGAVFTALGQVAQARGQLGEAQSYYAQSLAILREVGDRRGEGVVLANLGQVAQARGQLGEAQTYFEQSLAIRREVGDRQGEGVDLAQLGLIASGREQDDEAERYFRECLALLRAVEDKLNTAIILSILGQFLIEHQRGTRDEGCAMLSEAARLYDEMGVPGRDKVRATMRRLGCG